MKSKMKKILLIDDEHSSLLGLINLINLIGKDKNIVFSEKLYDYFSPKNSGKNVEIFNDVSDVELIFLHKSFNDPSIPEIFLNTLKMLLNSKGIKLFCFSGGSGNNEEQKVISRDTLYNKFFEFVTFSEKIEKWHPKVFYNARYKEEYIVFKLNSLKYKVNNLFEIENNDDFKIIKNILDFPVKPDSFNSVGEFIDAIINKIGL